MNMIKLHYCEHCEMLVFRYDASVTMYGEKTYFLDEEGWEEEEDVYIKDTETHATFCTCGVELSAQVSIPKDLYLRIRKRVVEDKSAGFKIKLDPDEFKGKTMADVRDIVMEALV